MCVCEADVCVMGRCSGSGFFTWQPMVVIVFIHAIDPHRQEMEDVPGAWSGTNAPEAYACLPNSVISHLLWWWCVCVSVCGMCLCVCVVQGSRFSVDNLKNSRARPSHLPLATR